jgi:uncharacterized protein (TIGR03382 family)
VAIDPAGNQGPASEAVPGTPVETIGFWEGYKNAGGEATGCAAAGGALAPLGLLGVALLRRRRS